MANPCNIVLFSYVQKEEALIYATTWMNPGNIKLKYATQKATECLTLLI